MKILIWMRHGNLIDHVIDNITHGKGFHAAFLREDGATVHEAVWPKLRERDLTEDDRRRARAFFVKGLTKQQHEQFEHLFDANLKRNIRYSILDLLRYAFNRPSRDEHHTFCSRYVLHCCHAVLPDNLMPLVRIPNRDWASPRDLLISPRLAETTF